VKGVFQGPNASFVLRENAHNIQDILEDENARVYLNTTTKAGSRLENELLRILDVSNGEKKEKWEKMRTEGRYEHHCF